MTEITSGDLDSDHWTTTEAVRDELEIKVGDSQPDYQKRIQQATRSVQADWADVTGKSIPDDLPDQPPELLQDATAYLAASMAHLAFASNVSGQNQGDQKHVFLEQQYDKTFERWVQQADLDAEGTGDDSDGDVSGVAGRRGSLTDDII